MKQKTADKIQVTIQELKKTLKYYPAKEELKNAEKRLRSELSEAARELEIKLEKKFVDRMVAGQSASRAESDYKFSVMQADLEVKFSKFTNRILTAIDPLLKELKTRQE